MWNVDTRRTSVITMSPGCPPAQLEAQAHAHAQAQAQAQMKREPETVNNTIMFRRAKRRQAAEEDVDQMYDPLSGYASLVGIGPPKAKPTTSTRVLDR